MKPTDSGTPKTSPEASGLQQGGFTSKGQTPEEWWAGLSLSERKAVQMLGGMIEEVTEKAWIDIRRESGVVRVRFLEIMHPPRPGCLRRRVMGS